MPKNRKDFHKRRLGYVVTSLNKAMEHTLALREEFHQVLNLDPEAPDYEKTLNALGEKSQHAKLVMLLNAGLHTTLQAQQMYAAFAKYAWGGMPKDVSRWTNTGQDWARKQTEKGA